MAALLLYLAILTGTVAALSAGLMAGVKVFALMLIVPLALLGYERIKDK